MQHLAALVKPKARAFLVDALGGEEAYIQIHSTRSPASPCPSLTNYSQWPHHHHRKRKRTDKPGALPAVSYELDDAAFAANEASDPFAARFVEFLAALLGPLAQRLGGALFLVLGASCGCVWVARRIQAS